MPVPLQWVIGTLTVWHGIVLAGFVILNLWPRPESGRQLPLPMRVWASFVIPVTLYCMVSLIVGQVVGDRFPWSMLWPAGLMLGALVSSIFLAVTLAAVWHTRGRKTVPVAMVMIVPPLAAVFFGLFFTSVWWIFPRVIEWGGLLDFPEAPWGVHLYRAP